LIPIASWITVFEVSIFALAKYFALYCTVQKSALRSKKEDGNRSVRMRVDSISV
jgi:hypothetical protein